MLIPVRCFTCNKVIGHKWKPYQDKVAEYRDSGKTEMVSRSQALDDIGLSKYCCRRMLLSHVDVIDQLLLYSNNPGEKTCPKYKVALPESEPEDTEEEPDYIYVEDQ